MNEQIQELLPKSKKVRVVTNSGMGYDTKEYFTKEQLEKFAEKLIKKGAQYVEDTFDFCGDELLIAEKLKEHFGVK